MDSYDSRWESKALKTSLKTSDRHLRPGPIEPQAIDLKKEYRFTNETLDFNRTLYPRTGSTDTGKFQIAEGTHVGRSRKMYCLKCGSQLPDDAAFCSKCGARTSSTGQTPQF